MDKHYEKSSASTPANSPAPKTNTFSTSDRLTKSEVEQLRRNQSEALVYAQKKYFPGARLA